MEEKVMRRGRFEIRIAKTAHGEPRKFWWVYIAPNGEIVCKSEMLNSYAAARKGIASVRRGVLNPTRTRDMNTGIVA